MPPSLDFETSDKGTWKEWARHVLLELERLNTAQGAMSTRVQEFKTAVDTKTDALRQEIQVSLTQIRELSAKDNADMRVELAMLKVKAGMWGAIGAAIPIVVTLAVGMIIHFATKK